MVEEILDLKELYEMIKEKMKRIIIIIIIYVLNNNNNNQGVIIIHIHPLNHHRKVKIIDVTIDG